MDDPGRILRIAGRGEHAIQGAFLDIDEGDTVRHPEVRAWLHDFFVRLVASKQREQADQIANAEQGSLLDGLIAARNEGEQLGVAAHLPAAHIPRAVQLFAPGAYIL
jgi:hypothetical protein